MQRIWGGGEGTVGTASDGTGIAGNGSSMSSSASDNPIASGKSLLVTLVFRVKVIQYSGIGSPAGVGLPPVQFSTMSPTCSAILSEGTRDGMLSVLHDSPEMPGAVSSQVSLSTPLALPPPKMIIRRLTASKTAAPPLLPTGGPPVGLSMDHSGSRNPVALARLQTPFK